MKIAERLLCLNATSCFVRYCCFGRDTLIHRLALCWESMKAINVLSGLPSKLMASEGVFGMYLAIPLLSTAADRTLTHASDQQTEVH